MRAVCWLIGFALVLLPATARAQATGGGAQASVDFGTQDANAPAANEGGPFVIGAELGAIFPQPFTELGTHVMVGIELGYRLPFIEQRLEIMLAAAFSPPQNSFTDQRDEGEYTGDVTQQELHFSLGGRYRFLPRSSKWNVNLAAGPRLYLLQSFSNGSKAGQEFAEFSEQSTQIGLFIALGGEYSLGPGALFLDLDFGWSNLPHTITGDVNTGNITASLGYRFFL